MLKTNLAKIIVTLISIFAIAFGIYFYTQNLKPENKLIQSSLSSRKIKLGYLPLSPSTVAFVAKEKGFFQKNNVDVELIEMSTTNQTAEGVINGDLDLNYYTSSVATLNANAKTPNKFKIYSVSQNNSGNFDSLYVKKDSPIQSIQDLAGKKIGTFTGNSPSTHLKAFLKKNSILTDGIEFVQLPFGNQIQALEVGSIDTLLAYEPINTTLALNTEYRRIQESILAGKDNPNAVVSVNTINSEFVTKFPAEAKNVIKAIDEAQEYSRNNPSEARQILGKYVKLTPEVLNNIYIWQYSKSTEIDVVKTQKYFDYMVELGEIKQKVNAEELIYKP